MAESQGGGIDAKMIQIAPYAAQVCSTALSIVAHPQPVPVEVFVLPSDGLASAKPNISLSTFFVSPGPRLEALMRAAVFAGTEHLYDL